MHVKAFYVDYCFQQLKFSKYVDQVFGMIDNGRCIEKNIEILTLTENALWDQVGHYRCVVFEVPETTPLYYMTTMGGTMCAVFRKKTPLRINGELVIVVDNRGWGDMYHTLSISECHSWLELIEQRIDKPLWHRLTKEDIEVDSVFEKVEVTPAGDLSDDEKVWLTLQRLA